MIVCKFGGTCCTHKNVSMLRSRVDPNCMAVVVSAVGKTHPTDTKVTDLLIALHQSLPDTSLFDQVAQKYQKLAKSCGYSQINALLDNTITDIVSKNNYFNTISKGEELSAKILAGYLGLRYVEAEDLFKFDQQTVNLQKSFSNVVDAYNTYGRFITGGFYGSNDSGRVTFSRGGSDVSASIVATALKATLYQNFTDVNGVCIANPTDVFMPQTVSCISYDDMYLMAKLGATVLHPDAVSVAKLGGITINVKNLFTNHFGTLVTNASSPSQILGICQTNTCDGVVCSVIHSVDGFVLLQKVVDCLNSINVQPTNVSMSNNLVQFTTQTSVVSPIYNCLLTYFNF